MNNINENIKSFDRILVCVNNRINKYIKFNGIKLNDIKSNDIKHNKLCKKLMNKYNLTNISVDIIILYNINKCDKRILSSDIHYFNIMIQYFDKYKVYIEHQIYFINSKIEFINKKNEYEINKLSEYNYKFHLLYNKIEECIKYIDKIQKYFLEEYFISNKNIVL